MKIGEYIWMDGTEPTPRMRSKSRVVLEEMWPDWNFDGSSTNQAPGEDSDVKLRPVKAVIDPMSTLPGFSKYLVLCECLDHDGNPIESNTRAPLSKIMTQEFREKFGPWVGFEQEYVILDQKTDRPLGFPAGMRHFPGPQGPYYCGVDGDACFGRDLVESHFWQCLKASLRIYGTNAEVMTGQHEFQIGLRGARESADALEMCDHLLLARFLLYREAEKRGCYISLDCKPQIGDWNGSGCHTNFSTKQMRGEDIDPLGPSGYQYIEDGIARLAAKHEEHIAVYGYGLEHRLTGLHETCDINTFKSGVADRGCSIRIPKEVHKNQKGYFEDRRPGANIDPYVVARKLIETVCVPEAVMV
jgi:glutamine synthetase